MSNLNVLSRGILEPDKIHELKVVLDKMISLAPFHIRTSIYVIELFLLAYTLLRFQKLLSNLNEGEAKKLSGNLENSRFQGFRMILKLQKSATYLVMYE